MAYGIPDGLPSEWVITIELLLGTVGLTAFLLYLNRIYMADQRKIIEHELDLLDRLLSRHLFPEEYEARVRAIDEMRCANDADADGKGGPS